MNAQHETLFWLIPSAEDEARFARVIEGLAAPREAAMFTPHLTLGAVRGEVPDLKQVLAALAGLTLSPLEIGETDVFTMSLFVRFQPTEALLTARAELERLPGFRPGRAFDPHISLCYGAPRATDAERDEIEALLATPVAFDQLVAMHIPLPVETQDDIRKWRETASFGIPRAF